jgi:hypothetical protein
MSYQLHAEAALPPRKRDRARATPLPVRSRAFLGLTAGVDAGSNRILPGIEPKSSSSYTLSKLLWTKKWYKYEHIVM